MLLAVVLGMASTVLIERYRRRSLARWLDGLLTLPIVTSAVTLGLGFTLGVRPATAGVACRTLDHPGCAHAGGDPLRHPQCVAVCCRRIPPERTLAARSLGASPLTTWRRIVLPDLARGLWVGAAFAFTISMGEFGASSFLARPDSPTIPTTIFRLIQQPGSDSLGQALAMSSILLAVCAVGFIAIEWLGTGSETA